MLGEASSRLDDQVKSSYPNVPWRAASSLLYELQLSPEAMASDGGAIYTSARFDAVAGR